MTLPAVPCIGSTIMAATAPAVATLTCLRATSAQAMPHARVARAERAAIAVGVRHLVRARHHRPELVLERRAHQRQRAHRLAVEAAPEADELVLAGVRLREPQRALDRLGAARVELQAVDAVGRRVPREPLDQLDARLAGERADRRLRRLLLHRLDPGRVRVAERVDVDAADEVEERVAVDVGDRRALGVVDDDARPSARSPGRRARGARPRARAAPGSWARGSRS